MAAKTNSTTDQAFPRAFYYLLANVLIGSITNMTVWFAVIFFIYLQTQQVLATAIISGVYLVTVAFTGFWFGGIVDSFKKKHVMLGSSLFSFVIFTLGFIIYTRTPNETFTDIRNPMLWLFMILLLFGVIAGNLRNIALPTLVTILIPAAKRDRANGFVGTVTGVAFLVVSVISGFLVGHSGMYLVLLLASLMTVVVMVHLWLVAVPEHEIVHVEGAPSGMAKLDIPGTIKTIRAVPGLLTLIFFTTFNNFLGGVFMALMDAYGLELVSVQVWGVIWGFLSSAFIVGGLYIARQGLGKNPLRALFGANITIWTISIFFTIQPSIVLLAVGMFIYLAVVPFIEAAEHTIIQKVVAPERQGRVFGFAQSIEMAASPLTSFLIGPLAQFVFIPFMTTGAGVQLIGSWFGTGPARGIALVFTLTGMIGLTVTLIAMRTNFYRQLALQYKRS